MRRGALLAGVFAAGVLAGGHGLPRPSRPAFRGDLELLAVTPGGSAVYRVNHPRFIVPLVLVESPSGAVAVR